MGEGEEVLEVEVDGRAMSAFLMEGAGASEVRREYISERAVKVVMAG